MPPLCKVLRERRQNQNLVSIFVFGGGDCLRKLQLGWQGMICQDQVPSPLPSWQERLLPSIIFSMLPGSIASKSP